MRDLRIISFSVIALIIFGISGVAYGVSKNSKEITYYIMSFTEKPGSKAFGCGEYLIPVKRKVAKADLKTVLKEFSKAHRKAMMPFTASQSPEKSLYGFNYFDVERVNEPKKPTQNNPIRVYLKKGIGKELGGLCDGPRATEPLRETIANYAASRANPPVQIFLDGSEKEWRCFDDATGFCE